MMKTRILKKKSELNSEKYIYRSPTDRRERVFDEE
jgi:hypothetical protein